MDRKELDAFRMKLQRSRGRAELGFFVSVNGFTEGFRTAREAAREAGVAIVLIDAAGIDALVQSADRNATLKELCDRSLIGKAP